MHLVVLTGISGSGKTSALRALEDVGCYAIDNLPVPLLDRLIEVMEGGGLAPGKLALVIDVRSTQAQAEGGLAIVPQALEERRRRGHRIDLVFLDCADETLARRFSETRRRHPLSTDGAVKQGLRQERRLLEPLYDAASTRVDTTHMSVHDLRRYMQDAFGSEGQRRRLSVTVMSFGFKHGLPAQADLVFDVRFLPNPYFVPELKDATGEDEPVQRFVLDRDDTRAFLDKVCGLLRFLIPRYIEEGKAYLTIAVGCTGGRHRSVAIANEVGCFVEGPSHIRVVHRDVQRGWSTS